jgi:hypothetical protein
MAKFEKEYCGQCRGRTTWIIKDFGARCTGCLLTINAPGPFEWDAHYCNRCKERTAWVECGNGLVICLGCGCHG